MTKQETFKRRIRERMLKTGERYGAARRSLIQTRDAAGSRAWAADPGHPDESIAATTGHRWDEWVTLIDAGPGRAAGHTAIASWVHSEHGVPGWWAQAVTVGYERITGIRLQGQMPDGTFSVSRSRTVALSSTVLRELLLDDADRANLLPGFETVLRSKPSSKSLRFRISRDGEALGVVMFSMDEVGERVRVAVTHEKIATFDDGEVWKAFWEEWLGVVAEEVRS
jgi:hypothetical protein